MPDPRHVGVSLYEFIYVCMYICNLIDLADVDVAERSRTIYIYVLYICIYIHTYVYPYIYVTYL